MPQTTDFTLLSGVIGTLQRNGMPDRAALVRVIDACSACGSEGEALRAELFAAAFSGNILPNRPEVPAEQGHNAQSYAGDGDNSEGMPPPPVSAMNAPIISPSGAPSHMEAGIAAHTLALSLRGKLADRRVCPAGL